MSSPDVPIFRRPAADRDLVDAVLWLRANRSSRAAEEFVDAVEEALALVSRHPLAGSAYAEMRLGVPGLRSFPVGGTPYILYYLARDTWIDLVRVVHGRRDVDADLLGS